MTTRSASLGRRLFRQFLLVGLLPVLGLTALATAVLLPSVVGQAEARNLELATAVRDQVQSELQARLREAQLVADEFAHGSLDPVASTRRLGTLVDGDPWVQAAYVTTGDGIVVNAVLPPDSALHVSDIEGLDQSAHAHFKHARERGAPTWSRTYLSLLTGRITAVLVVPAGERFLFVELALDNLSQAMADVGKTAHTVPVIVDRAGRVIAHPDPAAARRQESLLGQPLVSRAVEGHAGTARIVWEGTRYLAQALPVATLGWSVVVLQPLHQVLAPLTDLAWLLVATLLLTLTASAGLAWWLARRNGREVQRLADAAEAITAGHAPEVKPFNTSEFQTLWMRLRELFGELHRQSEQTQAARRDLQAVLDAATEVAIIATDLNGLVTVFSRGAEKMLQRAAHEVVGRSTPLIWHDPHEVAQRGAELGQQLGRPVQGFDVFVWRARELGHEVRDWTFVRADGQRLDVSLAVTAMHGDDGQPRGFLGVVSDVSERRRALELETARRVADAANVAKSDFLSRMSHELRTPLNAVLGYAQLLERSDDDPPTPRQRQQLGQIQRSGWHLLQLIDDVLDLSRIESGRMRIEPVALHPARIVARAREIAEPLMQALGVDFSVHWADRDEGRTLRPVRADPTRLTQVLVNLLSNAAKYNRPGGHVRFEIAQPDEGGLTLKVIDDGLGMSEAQLARLYEPFNRLGRETGAVEGTGIGLVITRRLIELMHGRLDVHSRTGQGSTFTVWLPPLDPSDAAPALDDSHAPRLSCDDTVRGLVLYVEDNPVNAVLMREVLRRRPQVTLLDAQSAEEALATCRRQRPDLLLLDMHLPDADGRSVMQQLHADPHLADMPVVAVSADATPTQIAEALALGVRAYLTKPLDVAQALATIDAALRDTGHR